MGVIEGDKADVEYVPICRVNLAPRIMNATVDIRPSYIEHMFFYCGKLILALIYSSVSTLTARWTALVPALIDPRSLVLAITAQVVVLKLASH